MANAEHVAVVMEGQEAIREWRKAQESYSAPLDLSDSDLTRANWTKIEKRQFADLSGAELFNSDLRRANLTKVKLSDAKIYDANLDDAILELANLQRVHISLTEATGVNLKNADLTESRIDGSGFQGANLRRARMCAARIFNSGFTEADLRGVDFSQATLISVSFGSADLTNATIGRTIFADVDLAAARGLDTIEHRGLSTIGIDTLYRSDGRISEDFLRSCGIPPETITHVRGITGHAIEYYACFISFTEADDQFSKELYADLKAVGVRCFRYKEDAPWGEPLWRSVDQAIRLYDKLVVICSRDSLQSEPVIREIERALQREQRDGKDVLFPIRIDDYVFEWRHELQPDVVRKHIGDFLEWKDREKYQKSLQRLIRDLQSGTITED